MGLDMYLTERVYVKNWDHYDDTNKMNTIVTRGGNVLPYKNISFVILERGYWRKANAIHNWFVENVQGGTDDCRDYYVTREQLTELRDICKKVKKDIRKAEELLPPVEGFFFGTTEIGDWYKDDLKATIEIINDVLDTPNELQGDLYYRSSW